MRRGTTHDFEIILDDVDLTSLAAMWVSFAQFGKVLVNKELDDVTIDGQTITVHLTQTDTLKFRPRAKVWIQIRGLTNSGAAWATDPFKRRVEDILKDGAISAGNGQP